MKSEHIRFSYRVQYGALRTVQFLITALPLRVAGKLLSGLLRFIFACFWPAKKESLSRMREVFGSDLSEAECRRIARTSVWNLVMNFVELMHGSKMTPQYLATHLEHSAEAEKILKRTIAKYGGVVLALPHMGNWDLAGVACVSFGIPLMAIARAQNNPLFDRWMNRNRLNFDAIDRRHPSSFIRIAHHLKGGGAFAILSDVRHNKPGVSVTVFGKPEVQLGKGLAKFARMGNVPIIPVLMTRLDASHHSIRLADPLFPNLDVDADADAVRLSQDVWNIFEAEIRRRPEQWFWHNRRWILTPLYTKTR